MIEDLFSAAQKAPIENSDGFLSVCAGVKVLWQKMR